MAIRKVSHMKNDSKASDDIAKPDQVAGESAAPPDAAGAKGGAVEDHEQAASKLIENFSMWAGVAGIIPIPVVDLAAIGGLQLQMVRRLSEIYDVPFSANRGKALIASLAGASIPTSSAMGAASVLKAIPFIGAVVSAFALPALSGGATYAIGKAFRQHFASGGTFLDFSPPDYREFIKAQKNMWSSKTTPVKTTDEKAAAQQASAPII
jgi:uncharacterized protein (DUF697 family)